MIWEEPESDGNSHILAYKVDWHRPGDERWTTATYTIDECALVKGLKVDTSYRFRVSAVNAFGISPYSWASVEIRTKKKGEGGFEGPLFSWMFSGASQGLFLRDASGLQPSRARTKPLMLFLCIS
jgi:hypothetical protein